MGVSLEVYRAAIGLYNCCISYCTVNAYGIRLFLAIISLVILFILQFGLVMLLLLSGSVHPNPGPRNTCMSIAHLNARSLNIVDKFSEISAIAELHKFDLLAFSETWLFLDISKAFDKVWHKGLLAKLKSIGINGPLLQWFESYLTERYQSVTIEGTSSDWARIEAGVPEGSVLGPLLFLIYINDIADNVSSTCFLFADDSLLLDEVISPIDTANKLNNDLDSISMWADRWLVTMNANKTKNMIFSSKLNKPLHPTLTLANEPIDIVDQHDHLGVTLTNKLSWRPHILKIHQKASKKLNLLKPMKFKLGKKPLEVLYKSVVRSCMEYADVVWDGCCDADRDLLESLQFEAARLVTGALKGTRRESLLNETGWSTLKARRNDHKLFMMYKIVNNLAPPYLSELRPDNVSSRSNRSLRANDNLIVPFARTERYKKSFYISSVNLWNSLSATIRSSRSIAIFKNSVTRLHKCVVPNPLYYIGDRLPAILHTRLRLSNSTLNYDLY